MEARDIMHVTKEKTGTIGAVFYFHPDTLARGRELGLSGMRFYAIGRGGVLGDVEPGVVLAGFGYFAPKTIAKWWDQSREVIDPRQAAREYIACNQRLGRAKLAGIDGLDAYVDASTTIIDAVDGGALSLFAGVRAEPVPEDVPAAAIHQAMVLRELRGSAHLAAIAAAGLSTAVAHAIKRPDMIEGFGYETAPDIDEADREALERAEHITDDILEPYYALLTGDQARALIAGTDAMYAALTTD